MSGTLRISHLSGDFPDSIDAGKTRVIRTLIDLTAERFDHNVISINRRSPSVVAFLRSVALGLGRPSLQMSRYPFDAGVALAYAAPPAGIYHATMLRQLGDWIASYMTADGPRPDLLVAHKLGIEGIAIRRAAELLQVPYALSIQGDSDTKVLKARPDLRREFARIFHDAAMVFPFAPWALKSIERELGPRQGPVEMLPCPTELDRPLVPQTSGRDLISIFHLKNAERKNLTGLVKAHRLFLKKSNSFQIDSKGPVRPVSVRILGGGEDRDFAYCRSLLKEGDQITFEGSRSRDDVRHELNTAIAFILPSLRESFGLVFIEALFAGLPIIYPAGTAVDGYFDALPFAVRVDARNTRDLADAMLHVTRNEAELKAELALWLRGPDAAAFQRGTIADKFAAGLDRAATSQAAVSAS